MIGQLADRSRSQHLYTPADTYSHQAQLDISFIAHTRTSAYHTLPCSSSFTCFLIMSSLPIPFLVYSCVPRQQRRARLRVSDGTSGCCDGGAAWSPSSAAADCSPRGTWTRGPRRTRGSAGCGEFRRLLLVAATMAEAPLRRLRRLWRRFRCGDWRMHNFADCVDATWIRFR